MRKILLSSITIALFGFYTYNIKLSSVAIQSSKPKEVAVDANTVPFSPSSTTPNPTPNPINSNTTSSPQVSRNVDCVFIPAYEEENEHDEENDENEDDDEEKEKGYYKCTTIVVTPPASTTPAINTTPATNAPPATTQPTTQAIPPAIKPKITSIWKDGTFIGDSIDAYYGVVRVSATISLGKITDITFLDYPQDRSTSLQKSQRSIPILKQEAISAQSAKVNSVSGATYTSQAFIKSLTSALNLAKA